MALAKPTSLQPLSAFADSFGALFSPLGILLSSVRAELKKMAERSLVDRKGGSHSPDPLESPCKGAAKSRSASKQAADKIKSKALRSSRNTSAEENAKRQLKVLLMLKVLLVLLMLKGTSRYLKNKSLRLKRNGVSN